MAKQLTPPVPWVRMVIPFSSGVGPKKSAFIAVPPAAENEATSSKERYDGARMSWLSF